MRLTQHSYRSDSCVCAKVKIMEDAQLFEIAIGPRLHSVHFKTLQYVRFRV